MDGQGHCLRTQHPFHNRSESRVNIKVEKRKVTVVCEIYYSFSPIIERFFEYIEINIARFIHLSLAQNISSHVLV